MFREALKVSDMKGANINHQVVAFPSDKGLCIIWQAGSMGQFDIESCYVNEGGMPQRTFPFPRLPKTSPDCISCSLFQNEWHPSAAAKPNGELCVAWDSFDGESYNVRVRNLADAPEKAGVIAGTRAFEGNAQIASDKNGKLWVS